LPGKFQNESSLCRSFCNRSLNCDYAHVAA
jgi:hypothetical protein